MKKTHRAVLSILLVLTLLATLPLTAMADDNATDLPMTTGNIGTNTGTIGTNEHTVDKNQGTITNNGSRGTGTNVGTVTYNEAVKTDDGYKEGTGFIQNNYGTITTNGVAPTQGASVDPKSGTIDTNYGNVGTNYGTINNVVNKGFVGDNQGYIGAVVDGVVNENNGQIKDVAWGTTVHTNNHTIQNVYSDGIVGVNNGTIGTVTMNGTVGENNNVITSNAGTVTTNNINGTVTNTSTNNNDAIIGEGSVGTNYGTVTKTDGKTYYGLQTVENVDDDVTTSLNDVEKDTPIDLTSYTREGYELAEYKLYQGGKGTEYTSNTNAPTVIDKSQESTYKITISMPSKLELFWKKITAVFTPATPTASSVGGGEAVPTSYNPKYIGLGSVIFINEKGYKVVEIKDDAYVVVTFDALPDEDVQDLDALYAKLFTPEQQKLIKNLGQLLDSEDVLTIFGKPGNHPVYEISKSLAE